MSPANRLRLFYFAYYGSVGAYLPYFAAYLRGLGFSGEEIGGVQMLSPLVAAPAALLWATAVDRFGSPGRGVALATALGFAAILFLPFARTPLAVAAVLLVQAVGDRAVLPLVDSVTVEWVKTQPRLSYARIRLFGSLGYVVVAQGLGLALMARGDRPGDLAVPLAVVAFVGVYALVGRRLPDVPRAEGRPAAADMLALLADRRLGVLLLACAFHWAACSPFHLFFGVFVRDRGLSASVTGLAMAVAVSAEVLALLAYPRLQQRLSPRALFTLSFAASAVRWLLTARAESAAGIVGLQALHAFTFGIYWGAAVSAMSRLVPPRLRATGQALFSAVVFGGGNAAGYALAGVGYDRYGSAAPLYAWAAALELVPLAGVLLSAGLAASSRRASSAARGTAPRPPPRR